jgi:L-fuconolactonase
MTLIDAHVHVWDPGVLGYDWLEGTPVDRAMLPAHYDRGGVAVDGVVFVQAADGRTDPVAEAHWVSGLDWPELRAIVAGGDLAAPPTAVDALLDALAGIPLVAGVRHLLQDTDVADFGTIAGGLRALEARGGSFDACIRHQQLPALTALLRATPDLVVVLDHVGKPAVDEGIDSDAGREWAAALTDLAARPHTFVKLSGMTAESSDADAFARHADAFLAHALEAFGPERTMIASDWPVSATFGVGGSFAEWVARVRGIVPPEAWDDVAGRTALRAYAPNGVPRLAGAA